MTDDDYDALSQKQLASIKRDMRISLEDAAVRATHKVMAEEETSAQRTWVGLTEDEITECFKITPDQYLPWQIYRRIETKLRSKNT